MRKIRIRAVTVCLLAAMLITYAVPAFAAVGSAPDGFDYAFIYGYKDTVFAPDGNVTREEASTVFYRILKQSGMLGGFTASPSSSFSDVEDGRWSKNALAYMLTVEKESLFGAGMVPAFDEHFLVNGSISPESPLTRAELAHLMAVTMGIDPIFGITRVPDITGHMYEEDIVALYDNNVVQGKSDGLFHPQDNVSRAEFTRMVNIVLGRTTSRYDISTVASPFEDVSAGQWFYDDVMLGSHAFTDGVVDYDKKLDRNELDMN